MSDDCISRQAAIYVASGFCHPSNVAKELAKSPSVTPKPKTGKWIPVSERLPEECYGCLVTVFDTDVKTQEDFENILPYFVGYDGETWNNVDGEPIPYEVIAWMPLPKPYKAEGSDQE